MAVEDEMLKTLQRIEQSLKGSTTTAGLGRSPRIAGGATPKEDKTDKDGAKTFKATAAGFSALNDASGKLTKTFSGLSKTVLITRENFAQLNRSMRASAKVAAPIAPGPARVAPGGGGTGGRPPVPPLGGGGVGGGLGPAANAVAAGAQPLLSTFSSIKLGLVGVLASIGKAAEQVTTDFFELHARGIDASSSLGGLYLDAIKSGMSFQKYTELLEKSGPAVVRAGSFREFNDRIMATSDQLAKLGVFGDDAAKLGASLATSATVLGVPQAQLADATTRQVAIFEQLHKTTLMLPEEFAKLTEGLQDNENVQGELLGISRSERAARLASIAQTNAIGYSMGLTTKASRALGDALLEQRKLTVEQRFKLAGGIQQMGAMTGMDPGDIETFARLARRKGGNTPEENRQFVELFKQWRIGQARLENSRDDADNQMAERMDEVTAPIAPLAKAITDAALTQQSKAITPGTANPELGKNAGALVEITGKLLSVAEGIKASPLATVITGAIGSVAFTLGVGTVIGKVAGTIMATAITNAGLGGAAGAGGPGAGGPGGAGKKGSKLMRGLKGAGVGAVIGLGLAAYDYSTAEETAKTENGDAEKIKGEAIGEGIGTVVGGVLGAFLGPLGAIVGSFLGGFGGKWLGGLLGAETATEKQAREAKKNTEAVKNSTAALKAQEDAVKAANGEVITSTDNLSTAVVNSAKTIYDADQTRAAEVKESEAKVDETKAQSSTFDKLMQAFNGAYIETTPPKRTEEVKAQSSTFDKLMPPKPTTEEVKPAGPSAFDKLMQAFSGGYVELGSAQSTSATAVNEAAGKFAEAAAIIATPGQTVRPTVTPPEVNTAAQVVVTPPVPGTPGAPTATIAAPDVVTLLSAMIALLQQSLDIEKAHAGFTEAILRATGRTQFADTDRLIDQVLRPRLS